MKAENCMDIAQKDLNLGHLAAVFETIFKCRRICFITNNFDCWLLMKFNQFIFLFDPLGISFPGKKKSYNRAIIYRTECIENAMAQLIECILHETKAGDECIFEIGGIDVKLIEKCEKLSRQEKKKVEPKRKCPVYEKSKEDLLTMKDINPPCSVKSSECSI